MRPRLRLRTTLLLLLAPLIHIGAASAHQAGVSTVNLDVGETTVEMELAVKGRDLDASLGTAIVDLETDQVQHDVLASEAARVTAHLVAGAIVERADGQACTATPDAPIADADGVILYVTWTCEPGAGMTYRNRLFVDRDPLAIQNVLILVDDDASQDVLNAKHDSVALTKAPPPSLISVFGRYVASGIAHIFAGYDHIAFLIALLLWSRHLWPVVKVVTAFTIAHSITLALAVLDVLVLPPSIVEPMIAVSIIWVAGENFFSRRIAGRWKVTFLLGLIHGFGFAGVLREFGLPSEALGLALAAFNVGVEIGQVVIVGLAVPALVLVDRLLGRETRSRVMVNVLSSVIAVLGLYWLIERALLT